MLAEAPLPALAVAADRGLASSHGRGRRLLRAVDRIGRVREDHASDLIAVAGNPLDDITVLRRPNECLKLVKKGGSTFKNEF